jgi:putative ABC transport system permease protein
MIRATFKSLLARKLRMVLSGLAVVLAIMFIAGSVVITDTLGRSFDNLFKNAFENVDVRVSAAPQVVAEGFAVPTTIPAAEVDRVRAVAGVGSATGVVDANGALVLSKSGKLLPNQSGARLGTNWVGEDEIISLRSGSPPKADNEIVLNQRGATTGGFKVGDTVSVKTPGDNLTNRFTLVGVAGYSGGRESIGGEDIVFFTEAAAQRHMLGQTGVFSAIDVTASPGTSLTTLQNTLKTSLDSGFLVETGAELGKKNAQPIKNGLRFFNYIMIGFGVVALLVGVFLILNTFSIIVAQRTRELALMRAMGASRSQMVGSVMIEALAVGVLGSALGLVLGVGVGALGAWGLGRLLSGGSLAVAGLAVPTQAILLAFGIGVPVTLIAALMPAVKAAYIPPVTAMRDAATPDRPLTLVTIGGAVVFAAGGGMLVFGLRGQGDATLPLVLAGVLCALIGVALLTPIACRPIVSLLGRLFSWSIPGKLGRRNSARNPRRTAITAAAVMIGIALVTGISTLVSSAAQSTAKIIDQQLKADLIVAGQQTSEVPPTIESTALEQIKAIPEVSSVAAVTYEFFAQANEKSAIVYAFDDWPVAQRVLDLGSSTGDINALGEGQIVVEQQVAKDAKLAVGGAVTLKLPKGERRYTVAGITTRTDLTNGFIIPMTDADELFRSAAPVQAYVNVKSGASVDAVKGRIDAVLANSPEVTVQTRAEFVEGQTVFVDFILAAVQILLLVAILISVLGVINTLLLSILERTRELGLLRAIGLRRSQTMRMITVESVVISLFGTLLGLGVGVGLGVVVVRALKDFGFTELALPWTLMVVYLFAAVIIGVGAAVIPAIRAARLNVLNAIAYE